MTARACHISASSRGLPAGLTGSVAADNRRVAPRKTISLSGLLKIPGLYEAVPCRIVEFSATGARVILDDAVAGTARGPMRLHSEVTLLILIDRIEVKCSAIWHRDDRIGLRFRSLMQAS